MRITRLQKSLPFLLLFALLSSACANSISNDEATVAPSPEGIPLIEDLGKSPIQMQRSDTKYTITFSNVEVLTESLGHRDIPKGQVLVVLDVIYEVQSGSLDILRDSDFEAYADGAEAVDDASFGYGLDEIGYVTLLAGTKAQGQFGYLVPSRSNFLALFFVDTYAEQPKIWQMNIPLTAEAGAVDSGMRSAFQKLWQEGMEAAKQGDLEAAMWEINAAYPGSLDTAKSEQCAKEQAANGVLRSATTSWSNDFSTFQLEPEWVPEDLVATDEIAMKPPLEGAIFSMVTSFSWYEEGSLKTESSRMHFGYLNGNAYWFPYGFCD